jgi:hypothetical protein
MALQCRECKRVIEPTEAVIVIRCGTLSDMEKCESAWHAWCAPMLVRQYVPPAKGGFTLRK